MELYAVFLKETWITGAPVFTDMEAAEKWLLMQKPRDRYYAGAEIKSVREEANHLRKEAAKMLMLPTQMEQYAVFLNDSWIMDAQFSRRSKPPKSGCCCKKRAMVTLALE